MRNRILIALLGVAATALAATTLRLALTQLSRPFPGFLVAANGIVSQLELPDWPGTEAGLRFNDRIVAIDGHQVPHGRDVWRRAREAGPGSAVALEVERPGALASSTFFETRVSVERFGLAEFLTVFLSAWGTGAALCVCGLLLALLRPDDRSVTGFLAVALSAGVMLMTAFDYYSTHTLYRITPIASAAFSGSVTHLGAILLAPAFGRRTLRFVTVGGWTLAALLGLGLELTMFSSFHLFVLFTRLIFLTLAFSVFAFTVASLAAARLAPDARERRRARIQALGVGAIACVPLGAAVLSASAGFPLPVGMLAPAGLGVGLVVPYLLAALVDEDRVIRLVFRDRYEAYQARQRSLEERVRSRTEALDDASRELRLYYRALSHDLRRPVVNLVNALKLQSASAADGDGNGSLRELALRSAQEAVTIVDSMLSAGRDVMRAEPRVRVDFGELVAEVASELSKEPAASGALIRATGEFPVLVGERTKLKHAVHNLLRNAVNYAAPGRAPVVTVHGRVGSDGGASVSFADNGIGIEPQYRERIFENFFRAPCAQASHVAGAGVGLAVVREVVERHGGTVGVDSVVGQGTTFELRFPPPAPMTPSVLEGRRVFLIDDDALCVFLAERGLAAAGAVVDSASSGELALRDIEAAFQSRGPEAVVVDLILPGIDGLAVIRALRERVDPQLPILLWSFARDVAAVSAAEAEGVTAFVHKSDSMVEDLITALRHLIREND